MPVLNTFPASPLPDFPLEQTPEYKVLEVAFGDGYVLDMPDGINSRTDKITLAWTNLNASEFAIIRDFLNAHAPSTPFLYTPAGSTTKVFKCRVWSHSQTNGGFYSVRATFTQYHGA